MGITLDKIYRASVEGKLLNKAVQYIQKLPKKTVAALDSRIGDVVRKNYLGKLPINDKQIMFISFQGDYACNPKYISQELLKRNLPYTYVFSARRASLNKADAFPGGGNVKLVEQYSADYYEAIATSKVIVANSVEFYKKPVPKRMGQYLIETWHGSLGIKKFGRNDYKSSEAWMRAADLCGKNADYIISNSTFEDQVYRETYWPFTRIMKYGHARNDILLNSDPELVKSIRFKVKEYANDLPSVDKSLIDSMDEAHYVLYAPTFRDDHKFAPYNVNFDLLTDALSKRFGGVWRVLIRLHPTVRKEASKYLAGNPYIINVTSYPDIQELLLISDAAITDYSSWIYDYMLTRKPGFIYATDVDMYSNERGLYFPLRSTPFPVAANNRELIENIMNFDQDKYEKGVSAFLEGKGCMEDGHASERAADLICQLVDGQKPNT